MRIYPGADGKFVLYEDDNYNYEKGLFTSIKFDWNEATSTLTIGSRDGTFPGMLKSRKFNIIMVDDKNGNGSLQSDKFTKIISYNGKEKIVKF